MPRQTGTILFIAIAAKPAGQIFELDGLPTKLAHFVLGISDNQLVIMFALFIFLIIVGMFMDATAAIYILVPILLPVVKQLGVSPLFFVVFLVITLSFGLITPPVGVCLYAAENVTGLSLEKVIKIRGAVAVPDRRYYLYLYLLPADHHGAHRPNVPQRLTGEQNKNQNRPSVYGDVPPEGGFILYNKVGAAPCGRPPVLRRGMSPHRPVGEGLAPPAGFRKAFILRGGFRPKGETL